MKLSCFFRLSALVACLLGQIACDSDEEIRPPENKFNLESPLIYPTTGKNTKLDDYYGHKVEDPYRWMEQESKALTQWIAKQRKISTDYLSQLPDQDSFSSRLKELLNYPRMSSPTLHSGYLYYSKNSGLEAHSSYYRLKKGDAETQEELTLNPQSLSEDGSVAASPVGYSKDGRYMTYGVQESGSDWRTFKIKDLTTKKDLKDELKWVKFSEAVWFQNGFYYQRYPQPKEGDELSSANENAAIYYHRIGTNQEQDELVYQNKKNPKVYFSFNLSSDGKIFFVYEAKGTYGERVLYKNLQSRRSHFEVLIDHYNNEHSVLYHENGFVWLRTDKEAPNFRVVRIELSNPEEKDWKTIIPNDPNHKLDSIKSFSSKLVAHYLVDASSRLKIFSLDGKFEQNITLPGLGSVSSLRGEETNKEFYFSFTSFTNPGAIYHYDVEKNQLSLFKKSEFKADVANYTTKQVFYESKDGTKVPMFIAYKKGTKLDGTNPTFLTAYGGFNISLTPYFSCSVLAFLEKGGVFAQPNIRGGGEYGETWHKAGMRFNKQNVFDDFIAAAEFLISEKYTSSQHLAIAGGSNGGLLVGAVLNQRPELFGAAIPAVGVMDMLKFQRFTIGHAWVTEYGSSEQSEEMFKYLWAYSPLHNIKSNLNYPAIMVETADHDDRVVPAHSFKYAATLQEKYKGKNPMLISISSKAGHGAGSSLQKRIKKLSDKYSFVLYHTK